MSGRTADAAVLVVGAGPSGAALALRLARAGVEVALVERRRHPRDKPCGECLNPGAVEQLRRLGLDTAVRERLEPAPLRGWCLRAERGHRALGLFGERAGPGWAVPRRALDALLAEAAVDAGARLVAPATAEGVEPAPEGPGSPPRVTVRHRDGRLSVHRPRLVVGADGLRTRVGRALDGGPRPGRLRKASLTCRVEGAGPERDVGHLVLGDGWTVGLAAVHARDPLWNATVVVDPLRWSRALAADPAALHRERLEAAGFAWVQPPRVVGGPWASGPFHMPARRAVGDGMLLVGDAAGYFDPLTGQGIYRALLSAELAAPVVVAALAQPGAVDAGRLRPYERALARALRRGRGVQRVVEAVVSHPRLRDAAIAWLGRHPAWAGRLVRLTGDCSARRGRAT
ncbi:MAG: hypothetical protein D6701_12520, partial [Gemmatimonadetes bacterium]